MNNSNNQTQSKNMKLVGTLFSYGGRQAGTGNLIATFVVSDPYEAGKNPDGSPKLEWNKVLEASLILPVALADTLAWEAFKTKAGKAGMRARVSIYGSIDIDRREPKPGERRQHRFWINPLQKDGALMVFPLVKRADAPAPEVAAAVPGDNTPSKHKELVETEKRYRDNNYELLKEWLACDGRGFEGEGYDLENRIPDFHMQEFINRMKAEMNAKAAKQTQAAKVKTASAKAKAKVTPVSADADAALPY